MWLTPREILWLALNPWLIPVVSGYAAAFGISVLVAVNDKDGLIPTMVVL